MTPTKPQKKCPHCDLCCLVSQGIDECCECQGEGESTNPELKEVKGITRRC